MRTKIMKNSISAQAVCHGFHVAITVAAGSLMVGYVRDASVLMACSLIIGSAVYVLFPMYQDAKVRMEMSSDR